MAGQSFPKVPEYQNLRSNLHRSTGLRELPRLIHRGNRNHAGEFVVDREIMRNYLAEGGAAGQVNVFGTDGESRNLGLRADNGGYIFSADQIRGVINNNQNGQIELWGYRNQPGGRGVFVLTVGVSRG